MSQSAIGISKIVKVRKFDLFSQGLRGKEVTNHSGLGGRDWEGRYEERHLFEA
jgi:hypothetical protein